MGLFTGRRKRNLEALAKSSPDKVTEILDLAKTLVEEGESEFVCTQLEVAAPNVASSEDRAKLLIRLANIQKSLGRLVDAIGSLEECLPLPGTDAERSLRHYLLGTCQLEQGRKEENGEARRLFEGAANNFQRAEELGASERLKKHLELNRGYALFAAGNDPAGARKALVNAAKIFKRDELAGREWVRLLLTLAQLSEKDPARAQQICEKALEFAEDDADRGRVNVTLARLALKAGDFNRGVEKYEAAARYFQDGASSEDLLAIATELPKAYFEHNQISQAIKEGERALASYSLDQRARFVVHDLLAEAYVRNEDLPKAILNRFNATDLAPNAERRAHSLYRLGLLQMRVGEYGSALSHLLDAQESGLLGPTQFAESQLATARCYLEERRADDAIRLLSHVLNLGYEQRRTLRARDLLAEAYMQKELWVKAAEIWGELAAHEADSDLADNAKARIRELRLSIETGSVGVLLSKSDKETLAALFATALGEKSFFERLQVSLTKTRDNLVGRIEALTKGRTEIDDDLLDDLEEILITSDLGVETTQMILGHLHKMIGKREITKPEEITHYLKGELNRILLEHGSVALDVTRAHPFVLMVIGVNGVGKTTTIAKLAHRYTKAGKKVLLVAGDTFRAGAIEQLAVWAERIGCDIVRRDEGTDPSAVAYQAMEEARKRTDLDLIIVDTAGRLHTKTNLMEELKKVKRVIAKHYEDAPHEVLLVLDSTNGQNAINQAKTFNQAIEVDGIALTKLDGTAKGGIVVTISHELKIPVKFIGIGEKMDDLRDFVPEDFVNALFAEDEGTRAVSTKDTGNAAR